MCVWWRERKFVSKKFMNRICTNPCCKPYCPLKNGILYLNKMKLKPALFTSIRIKRDTVPDGLYTYDVRHDDECRGIPCEIAPYVMVNHWGTIILAEPLELPDDGWRYIDEETDWNYDPFDGAEKKQKPCTTVAEFMRFCMNNPF